jgi:hypothetical protein
MESTAEQRVNALETSARTGCGRPGCACGLPISERFVLWALRQWQQDRALPAEGSVLHQGFKTAGVLEVLPDFAIAMDAFLLRHAPGDGDPSSGLLERQPRRGDPGGVVRSSHRATSTGRCSPRSTS